MLNKAEKAVEQYKLDQEKAVLKKLVLHYEYALKGINERLQVLQAAPETQSKVYQKQYQETLKKQVSGILERLHSDVYSSLDQYMHDSYTTGFVGTMYDLHYQNVPLLIPINQDAILKAVQHDTKLTSPLYDELGIDTKRMSRFISREISRGLASGLTYDEVARNIKNVTKAPLSRAKVIARTEGHRIQQASSQDAAEAAKAKGADIVKQWDATLDGDTRTNHRQLDGQIRELDEPFEVGKYKPMYPGDFGDPAEDCNCRCVSLKRARAALDEDELKTLRERAVLHSLYEDDPKAFRQGKLPALKSYEEFQKNYPKAAEAAETEEKRNTKPQTVEDINKKGTEMLLDAHEERRLHYGLSTVPADELRNSPINTAIADYTGLSVQTAEAFNDTITRLSKEYYTGFQRIEVGDPKEFFGAGVFATTQHISTAATKTLIINPLKTKDYDKLVERVEELSKKGYAVKLKSGKAGEYIATHEFAHSLLDIGGGSLKNYVGLDVKPLRKARKEITDVFTRYKAEVGELERACKSLESRFLLASGETEMKELQAEYRDKKKALDALKISRYSMENADEFMAEAFTQSKIGAMQSPYTSEVMAILDRLSRK